MVTQRSEHFIAGRFEVIGRPLMGGMGVVLMCFDHANDRAVALKTFRPELLSNRAARDRFLREGHLWVNLGHHPHIVRAFEVLHVEGGRGAYLVLELIAKEDGRRDASLRSYLEGRPLPLAEALALAIQIARGLDHATTRIPGFVHRDLKPENVLVGRDRLAGAAVPRLRVTDFGLAKVLEEEQAAVEDELASSQDQRALRRTRLTRGAMGTPLYMAPEQWDGGAAGVATDVYAFGCIVQEMLSGRSAAPGVCVGEVERAHREGKLESLGEDAPALLRAFLRRCLAREPAERFTSWEEVGAALDELSARLTGNALPPAETGQEPERADRVRAGWSFNELGYSYLDIGKLDVACRYFERALEVSRREGDRSLECSALGHLGIGYSQLGDPRHAIQFLQQSLAIAREIGDRAAEGTTFGNLGVAHRKLGEVRRAIDYFERDVAIAREIGDRIGEGRSLGNLGNAYGQLGDLRRAIDYYEQRHAIALETGDRIGEGNALGSLGGAYVALGDPHRAISYIEQHLAIARETGNLVGEGNALGNLGNALGRLGDVHHAIGCYERCLAITRETGNREGLANTCFNLAVLFARQQDIARAESYATKAAEHFEAIGSPNGARARSLLATLASGLTHGRPSSIEDHLRRLAPILDAAAAAARGDRSARAQVEATFDRLTEGGFQIAEPIRRIWSGDRDESSLTRDLDATDTALIRALLSRIAP